VNSHVKRVLVTGGAGFIGSHIVDKLVEEGYDVIIYDNLDPQVHEAKPDYLNEKAEFIEGDVRDKEKLKRILRKVDIVSHHAAVVGIGQSMYEIERYVDVNTRGTAVLLDLIVNDKRIKIEKLIIASSMSAYGEGAYYCTKCREERYPNVRKLVDMKQQQWEHKCSTCGNTLEPKPTLETKPLSTTSIYAQSKKNQEEMALMIGRAYGIPTIALRYFNVYGPRQSLNNPYTGVCAIFSSRIKNNHPPLIYEDGNQKRDFVYVTDIARVNQLVIGKPEADMQVFNVGTGKPRTIKEIADLLLKLYGTQNRLKPEIVGKFREGDIRHCYADISKIRDTLGFKPRVSFEHGMKNLIEWGKKQAAKDDFEKVEADLKNKGLLKS
jgi:dTDP-L-rhamnose 4-epimerase